MKGRFLLLAGLAAGAFSARGDTAPPAAPALLSAAMGTWTSGKEDWSFLRRTRTLDDDGAVKDERLESYDPSQPDDRRWRLLEVDGKPPTPDQLAVEQKKNRRPRKYSGESPGQLLELPRAIVRKETADAVTYEVPVKSVAAGLVQTNKLVLMVVVDRSTQTVERLTAQLRGPMRIALGLAKITDVDLQLSFDPKEEKAKAESAPPTGGTAKATLSAFGQRMEYEWTKFKPVKAYGSPPPESTGQS